MIISDEELLEPLIRYLRFNKGTKEIQTRFGSKPLVIADLGCGPSIRFYHYALKKGLNIDQYIGIDPLISDKIVKRYNKNSNITIKKSPLSSKINLQDKSVNCVVAFAFLEHTSYPKEIIDESLRVLKKGGIAIFTTPSFRGKVVLEFLCFKLGLVSRREIEEHKNYFDKKSLFALVGSIKGLNVHHKYFEFGMNNLLVIEKNV